MQSRRRLATAENEYSLEHGFRLLSAYKTNAGDHVGISKNSVNLPAEPKEAVREVQAATDFFPARRPATP